MADTENNSTDEQAYKQLRDEVRDYALERGESLGLDSANTIYATAEASLIIIHEKVSHDNFYLNAKALVGSMTRLIGKWHLSPGEVGK